MSAHTDFLPFAKPSLSEAAIAEVVACLRSGWLTTGPRVEQFEQQLRAYLHTPHALALASATAGLQLALQHLNLQPGDEVITTPLTFVASLNTIVQAGGKPVLVDIDPVTYQLNTDLLPQALSSRTRAILPVHFTGLPVDLDPLYAFAQANSLRVIEDAAQAMGTEYKGKRIGSFGDTQVFSFHPNKVMTTGEGGCVATHDASLAKSVHCARFHGIDRTAWDRFAKNGSPDYDVVTAGYKYNMMDIQAALGLHQLAALEELIQQRTVLAERYLSLLKEWPQLTLPGKPTYAHRHSWHLFAVLINETAAGINRDMFMDQMKTQHNIGTGLHYRPAHLYSFYRERFGFQPGDFPHAENLGTRIVSLPLFPDMTYGEQDRVIQAMATIFNR